ncbi:hypothetical protein [Nocardia gamkensis]|uniref:Uncharacterized protein n=1 Tax=Nocardia gamkensis TaxID=352869 RepID=A0A7X6R4D4_9NOCA|nr:hypothetical protein [Nocardia gamkensis]NKY28298.1 hypothetical protein [Nocardia gamkensis]NQE71605.1 hypothetical protein [Nocardia gamkensis]
MWQLYRAVFRTDDHRVLGYVDVGARLMEHVRIGHHLVQGIERLLAEPARVTWAGRSAPGSPKTENLYHTVDSVAALLPPEHGAVGRYLLNHDMRIFVDKATVLENEARHRIHPLPLLTADPTPDPGRTVGDHTLLGSWAHALISVRDTVPKGFEQRKFDLVERLP